jgi:hypothetical protein
MDRSGLTERHATVASRRTSGVMAGSQQDTASGLAYADDVASSRCAEDAILADQQLLDTVGGTDLGDQLSHFGIPVTTITTDHEG